MFQDPDHHAQHSQQDKEVVQKQCKKDLPASNLIPGPEDEVITLAPQHRLHRKSY
ncbi:MAG: hypothetical protein U5J96_04485 [Ignavibacteriaceae bacterium]|nr:hypothetical protein [Ignavibacteriaceae bacterium]